MNDLISSKLFDERTFYQAFMSDLLNCKKEVIIESPYITSERMNLFRPIFNDLLSKKMKIFVITRDPREHYEGMEFQSEKEIANFERIGVQVLLCVGNHHRKLAILDRKILWEGSLNIFSQIYSREIMRRIENEDLTLQTFNFLKLGRLL